MRNNSRQLFQKTRQAGFTLTEMVVASSLLVASMAIVAPTAIRNGQLARDTRVQLIAMDELANEMERLTSLDGKQRRLELEDLNISDHLDMVLPNAELSAKEVLDSNGARLVLSLQWDRIGDPKPVTLVGWIDPMNVEESE